MHTTTDGFAHQSRQDDLFEDLQAFADTVFQRLLAAVKNRPLTDEENDLICRAADLANSNHIYRVTGAGHGAHSQG